MLRARMITEEELRGRALEKAIPEKLDSRFYAAFREMFVGKDGKLDLYGNRYKLKDLDGFPAGLDLENCELIRYGEDVAFFQAGGDWQQGVNFAVGLKNGKLAIVSKFEDTDPQTRTERKQVAKVILGIRKAISSFESHAKNAADSIWGAYCDLGLSSSERRLFDARVEEKLAETQENKDGEKIRNGTSDALKAHGKKALGTRFLTEDELRAHARMARRKLGLAERRHPEELAVGEKVEMEHTNDPEIARIIAADHIFEDPHYYSKLIEAGLVDEPEAIQEAREQGLKKSDSAEPPKKKVVVVKRAQNPGGEGTHLQRYHVNAEKPEAPEKKLVIRFKKDAPARALSDAIDSPPERQSGVFLGKTPAAWAACGAPGDLPVMMPSSIIRKLVETHELTKDQIMQVHRAMAEPVAVLRSARVVGALLVVTDVSDGEGRPIVVAVKPEGGVHGAPANVVTSIYGRNNFGDFMEREARERGIIYFDEKKWAGLVQGAGKRYPRALTKPADAPDYITPETLRNPPEAPMKKSFIMVVPLLEKARKSPRLVPVKRTISRGNQTYTATVWVSPEDAKRFASGGQLGSAQGDLFDQAPPAIQGDLFDQGQEPEKPAEAKPEPAPAAPAPAAKLRGDSFPKEVELDGKIIGTMSEARVAGKGVVGYTVYSPGWKVLARGATPEETLAALGGGKAEEKPAEPEKKPEDGLPDPAGHKVGETIVKDGVTYRLNENHRWERVDDAEGEGKPAEPVVNQESKPEAEPDPSLPKESDGGPEAVRSRMTTGEHEVKTKIGTMTLDAVFLDGKPMARIARSYIMGASGEWYSLEPISTRTSRRHEPNDIIPPCRTLEEALSKYAMKLYADEMEEKARKAESAERAKKIREAKRQAAISKATPATRNEAARATVEEEEAKPEPAKPESYSFTPGRAEITAGDLSTTVDDYTGAVPAKISLVSKKTILEAPRPTWIPEISDSTLEKSRGRIEGVKLGPDRYLIGVEQQAGGSVPPYVSKYSGADKAKYAVVNLAVLAATQDYYSKLRKARFDDSVSGAKKLGKAIASAVRSVHGEGPVQGRVPEAKDMIPALRKMPEYAEIPEGSMARLAEMAAKQYGAFLRINERMKQAGRSDYSLDKYLDDYLKSVERDANRSKPKTIGSDRATYFHLGLVRLTKLEADTENKKWAEIRAYMADLKQMSSDMDLQLEEDQNTYAKGRETAYGRKGAIDPLLESHGVVVKRQNGDDITPVEVEEIKKALSEVYEVFGDRSSLAKRTNLLISHAGEKMMHARKALGLYIPTMTAIGVTWGLGEDGAGFTLAHEFAHFMDNQLGTIGGRHRYASDDRTSLEYQIADTFRSNMAQAQESDYQNRTCECFARALEQYFTIENDQADVYQAQRNVQGNHPEHNVYMERVYPLVKRFLSERGEMLKSIRLWRFV